AEQSSEYRLVQREMFPPERRSHLVERFARERRQCSVELFVRERRWRSAGRFGLENSRSGQPERLRSAPGRVVILPSYSCFSCCSFFAPNYAGGRSGDHSTSERSSNPVRHRTESVRFSGNPPQMSCGSGLVG